MMVINKKKVRREGVNTLNLSSTDDSDITDDETASSEDEPCVSSTPEIPSAIIAGVSDLSIMRCDCKTKC
jgi:hypothetical protein